MSPQPSPQYCAKGDHQTNRACSAKRVNLADIIRTHGRGQCHQCSPVIPCIVRGHGRTDCEEITLENGILGEGITSDASVGFDGGFYIHLLKKSLNSRFDQFDAGDAVSLFDQPVHIEAFSAQWNENMSVRCSTDCSPVLGQKIVGNRSVKANLVGGPTLMPNRHSPSAQACSGRSPFVESGFESREPHGVRVRCRLTRRAKRNLKFFHPSPQVWISASPTRGL